MSIFSHKSDSSWSFHREPSAWPLDANGEKEQAVLLKSALDSPAESDMLISFLQAYNIPCFAHYAKEGGAGKVINGFSGYGVDLYVPASKLEEAKELLCAQPVEEDAP